MFGLIALSIVCFFQLCTIIYLIYKLIHLSDRAQDRLSEALLESSKLIQAKSLTEHATAAQIAAETNLRVQTLSDTLHDQEPPEVMAPRYTTLESGTVVDLNHYTLQG